MIYLLRRWVARVAAVPNASACIAVVGVLALSACSSPEPEAAVTQQPRGSVTESATPTPRATVTPPVMPPEIRERTSEGAEAFVTYWFDVLAYSYATGDTEELQRLSGPECDSCHEYIAEVAEQYADGGSFEGVGIDVLSAVPAPIDERGFLLSVEYVEHASRTISASGAVQEETPGRGPAHVIFAAEWAEDGWLAFGLGVEE